MRNRIWILHELVFLSIIAAGSGFGSTLNPSQPGSWNSFRIGDATHSLMQMEIQFLPTREASRERFQPNGLLSGLQAPGDRLLSCSWPSMLPDRDDHFSAKWMGYWQPGKGKYEIRLRASHHAVLALDGQTLLECNDCPAGVTAALDLNTHEHPLQLDYSHTTGTAYAFLDWREPGRAWHPVEVRNDKRKGADEGWKAEYYLGENFEKLAFARIDPQITVDWKTGGPLDRPEDLPTLIFRWGHRDGAFLGEISSNRKGYLWLIPSTTETPGQNTPMVKGTNTSLTLTSADGKVLLGMLFDEGGTWWKAGQEADSLDPTNLNAGIGPDGVSFLVPVRPERPIRFWEDVPEAGGGSWVTNTLNATEKDFERSRPHLGEDLSTGDTALFSEGRWWARVFLEAMRPGQASSPETPGHVSATRQHLLTSLAAGIPSAVSAMTSLCMPDLIFAPQTSSTQQEAYAIGGLLQSDATGDLEFLARVLQTIQSPGANQKPSAASTGPAARWPIHGFSRGLAAALSNFLDLHTILSGSGKVGFNILPGRLPQRTFKIENWTTHGDMGLDLTISPTGIRIEQKKGVYLQFDRPLAIQEFRIGKRGEWTMKTRVEGRVNLEAGPTKSLKEATWNHNPLLMTQREERFLQGTLPEGEGEIRIEWAEREKKVPRF